MAASAVLGAALGPLSEWASVASDRAVWVPDLAVGWAFLACGLVAIERRAGDWPGALLLATGVTWFLPNFTAVHVVGASWLASHLVYLHRGPLLQLLLTFPAGRPASRTARTAVAVGYLTALTSVWADDLASIPLAGLFLALAVADLRRLRGSARRARAVGLRALLLLTSSFAGGALARLLLEDDVTLTWTRLVAEASLGVVAVGLLVSLLTQQWTRAAVTDLVVELGAGRTDALRDDLARALGDPSLQIGYWAPDQAGWVDARGRPFSPSDGPGRAMTPVDGPGGPLAVLVHDPALLDDPGLVSGLRSAAGLAAANARLRAEVRGRVAELEASRRRLLDAGDDERRKLEARLHDGARRRLERLGVTVATVRATALGPRTTARLVPVADELTATLADLALLGRGLHPRELGELGLVGSLRRLASRAPFRVAVTAGREVDPDPAVAAAAYYVCSEALANVSKHAAATSARIDVSTSDGHLVVQVADDGVGGAELAGGSGLTGLADRVETLGGSLVIVSPVGSGTRVEARIPLGAAPAKETEPRAGA